MQHSLASAAAKQDPKSSRKRKQPGPPPSNNSDTTATPKQQTISDLFSSQQRTAVSQDSPPTSKRPKLPAHTSTSPASLHPSGTPLPPSKMYNFPSRSPPGKNVIDLTSSPGASPSPRRPSVARPLKPTFNPHAGAKKLVVKNLRTSSGRDPRAYLEQVWALLDKALGEIFEGVEGGSAAGKEVDGADGARRTNGAVQVKLSTSMEELYKGVENLCRQGHAGELCERLEGKSKRYISEVVRERLLEKANEENADVLRAVLKTWAVWNRQVVSLFLHIPTWVLAVRTGKG